MPKFFPALLGIISLVVCLAQPGRAEVVDDFSDASRWEIVNSDGVDVEVLEHREDGHDTVLRVDIEFVTGGGYGGVRRELPLNLPANFELSFSTCGDLPPNDLEFKLVDESGENVWWVNRRRFEFPEDWTRLASRRRHFEFAWGPTDAPLRRAYAIEIFVASAEGGRGTLYLDDLALRPLPETHPYTGKPTLTASSHEGPSFSPQAAMDGQNDSQWRSAALDAQPTLTVDFGMMREFGGLVLHWDPAALPNRYAVEFSDDGKQWKTVRQVDVGSRMQFLSLPDAESRAVRLAITPPAISRSVALREIEVLPVESSRDANAFAAEFARRAPRGHHPRATLGEGTFWTLVGVPLDDHEALVSEDGAVEVDKRGFSIEPFLWVNGELHTWADAAITQTLAEGCAPVPTVLREYDGLSLEVTAFADGDPGGASLWLLHTLSNTSEEPIEGSLLLALRPFQVNPPYQWLNTVGGVANIERIGFRESGRVIAVDDKEVVLGATPDSFGSATFDEGDVTTFSEPRKPAATRPGQRSAARRLGSREVSLPAGTRRQLHLGVVSAVFTGPGRRCTKC